MRSCKNTYFKDERQFLKKRGKFEKRRNIPEKERVCKEAKLVILDRTFCEGVTKAKWPKMADFRGEFQRPESLRRPV